MGPGAGGQEARAMGAGAEAARGDRVGSERQAVWDQAGPFSLAVFRVSGRF